MQQRKETAKGTRSPAILILNRKAIQKVKNVCAYSPRTCIVAADHWFLVQCDVKNCLMQLYVGPCHVVNAEIGVAMVVPIENPADCEVGGVISFLQAG